MKVILLKNINKVGRRGEVKDFAEGYVRNFLVPNKIAEIVSNKSKITLKAIEQVEKLRAKKKGASLKKIVKKIRETEFVFFESVAPSGKLFASVTANAIKKRIEGIVGEKIERVQMLKPIKETGEFSVDVYITKEKMMVIKIIVSKK